MHGSDGSSGVAHEAGLPVDESQLRELLENSQRLRDILEHTNEMIASLDQELRFLYVNRAWSETLRHTPSSFLKILAQGEVDRCRRVFEGLEPGERASLQTVLVNDEGRPVPVEGTVVGGHGIQCYFRDVTEKRRFQQTVEQFFRMSLDMLVVADHQGRFIHVNPAWAEVLGYSQEELVNRPYLDFVHPEDKETTLNEARQLTRGHHTVGFENRYRCKDGSYRWLLWSAASSPDLVFAVARDVTERSRLLYELKEQRQRLAAILQNVPDGIITVDEGGMVETLNPAAERLFGCPAEEVVGGSLDELVLSPAIAHWPSLVGGSREGLGRRSEGKTFPMELSVGKIELDDRTIFTGIVRDITQRIRDQETTRRAREAAEAASLAKSAFLAGMSHELRTPLNAIIGFSELLADETFGELNSKQSRYVANILTSGKHLLGLINDILDLSKIEAGRMEVYRDSVEVSEIAQEVIGLVSSLARQKELTIELEEARTGLCVLADPARLRQIFYNLLSNAIKFTPEGGEIRVLARTGGSPETVRISVTDTGVGIDPADQERVFGSFEQLSTSGAPEKGTGLGLALTRRLVELQEGSIWVESLGIGQGSTFVFELPAAPPTGAPSAREPDPSAPLVLVVEDNPQASELLYDYLTEAGYRVAQAFSGGEALRMVKDLAPDAITLDLCLPGLDGWSVFSQLKADVSTRSIPVVIVSMLENVIEGFSLGASDFFLKPVDRERLLSRMSVLAPLEDHGRLLLIDDDSHALELYSQLLEDQGYQVIVAQGGRQGVEAALEKQPDAIVLDLLMPEVSGFEVVRTLRADERTREIPIVILSARELSAEDRAFLNSQIQAIASKSESNGLTAELRRVLQLEPHHSGG